MSSYQRKLSILLVLLSLLGVALSVVSLFEHTMQQYGFNSQGSFCNINATFNCDLVNQSSWSRFLGIPLASYGITFYVALLLIAIVGSSPDIIAFVTFRNLTLVFGFFASILSVVLFLISEIIIGSLCLMCIGLYLINFAIFFSAFFLEGKLSFFSNLKNGLAAIFRVPKLLIYKTESNKGASQFLLAGLLTLGFVGFLSVVLPDFFLVHFVKDKQKQQTPEQEKLVADAIARWENQTIVDLPLVNDGSNRDYQAGSVGAPIRIVEYSDFECPACRRFYAMLEPILEQYKGKIHITYKNYPLDQSCNIFVNRNMHQNACFASYFARCAGEQDKFWEATDFLFKLEALTGSRGVEKVNEEIMNGAEVLSLDKQALQECVNSDRVKKKIKADIEEGNRLKIPGTPTVWINGKYLQVYNEQVIHTIFEKLSSGSK